MKFVSSFKRVFPSLALVDRANEVSLKADQVKSGASDTTCDFNAGGDNYFEWTIKTSGTSYNEAFKSGSFKTATDLQNSLVSFFRTKLSALYPNQIANVTFISEKTASNGGHTLTFRIYYLSKMTLESKRTEIVSKIQGTYYDCLTRYFTTASKSMKIPTAVNINVPAPVSTVSKKAVILTSGNSSKSVLTGSLLHLTKVSSSSK